MATIQIDALNIDSVKCIIELLGKYIDDLPSELSCKLKLIADSEALEIGYDEIVNAGANPFNCKVLVDGVGRAGVCSVNTVLKRVRLTKKDRDGSHDVQDNKLMYQYEFPESLRIIDDNFVVVEW